jgi:hypothetical protein
MTNTNLECRAPAGNKKVSLILGAEFRRRLGGISRTTHWRLEREDPRHPTAVWLRGRKAWAEADADDYVAALLSNADAG